MADRLADLREYLLGSQDCERLNEGLRWALNEVERLRGVNHEYAMQALQRDAELALARQRAELYSAYQRVVHDLRTEWPEAYRWCNQRLERINREDEEHRDG